MSLDGIEDVYGAIHERWMSEGNGDDELEEGELAEPRPVPSAYNPELEWPGPSPSAYRAFDTPNSEDVLPGLPPPPRDTFRLLVSSSSILPRTHRLAIIDGAYPTLELGRDLAPAGADVPRVRLKEMAVSKLHATLYRDADGGGGAAAWHVVDMGSKHGTFVRSARGGPESSSARGPGGVRLSAPRVASLPRALRHLDELAVGGTTFVVHIHADLPCVECSAHSCGDDVIPLFAPVHGKRAFGAAPSDAAAAKRKRPPDAATPAPDARQSLTSLRKTLLSQHTGAPSRASGSGQPYMDRSAKRRALHPSSRADTPGARVTSTATSSLRSGSVTPSPVPPSDTRILPAPPPPPISATNVGHKLLLKQGWTPGTALGGDAILPSGADDMFERAADATAQVRLVEPLDLVANAGRTGLGAVRAVQESTDGRDWREDGKRRRWEAARSTTGRV